MTINPQNNSQDQAQEPEISSLPDTISDPALNTEPGHDWSDEGGATPNGPAVPHAPENPENEEPSSDDSENEADSLPGEPKEIESPSGSARLGDPRYLYPKISPPKERQPEPGLDTKLVPKAFSGAESYKGTGKLEGRRALITGGDSGIGAAVAIAFAREGAHVAIGYLPSEQEDADSLLQQLNSAQVNVVQLPGDLRDKRYLSSLVDRAAQELGGLDILVNNAGKQISVDDIKDLSDEQVEATFQVNVMAMFTLCRNAVEIMPPGASIINTTSIQAYDPSPHLLDYAATKAAINNFTKGLAAQVGPRGIRVNAVAPGPVWTPLQPTKGQPIEKLPEFGHNTYLGRAGQPAEVAYAYVFLAQPESSFILGETINVNGGRVTP